MFYFVFGTLVIWFIFWLTELKLGKRTKINDTSKVAKSEVTDIPTKADIERHNAQLDRKEAIKYQHAKQHIIDILDTAYKDYVNKQIKKRDYIECIFILDVGDYDLTVNEIYAIRDKPIKHDIYKVEYQYADFSEEPWLVVTVDN